MYEIEEIEQFRSWFHFEKFLNWIEKEKEYGSVQEIEVKETYDCNIEEHWFLWKANNQVWRLVYPDPPFTGFWKRVQ